jgi:hypothetical protein
MKNKKIFLFILMISAPLFQSCAQTRLEDIPSPNANLPTSTLTEISEKAVVATEHWIQTQNALTQAALPAVKLLPTLTPIANSTPSGAGAYMVVPPDVLGSHYEIQNAYYFDTLEGRERYEMYAGAIAESGDEYTAQGVLVLRTFKIIEKNGITYAESTETIEYLANLQVGPLSISTDYKDRYTGFLLTTPLNYVWFFNPHTSDMYLLSAITPLARVEVDGTTQVATLNGDGESIGTNPIPLTGKLPFTARLRLPFEKPPDTLSMSAMQVSPPGILQYDGLVSENRAEWRTDCSLCTPPIFREAIRLGNLPLIQNQDVRVSVQPGFYVLIFDVSWSEVEWFGYVSATYGFLIEVQE